MGVRSTLTTGGTLKSSHCCKVARKRKTSHLARTSPMHQHLPMLKSITFSLKVSLMAVPLAVRNYSSHNSMGVTTSSCKKNRGAVISGVGGSGRTGLERDF